MIVLDLGLPDMDGKDVLRRGARSSRKSPIIVLSARDREAEKIAALDLGADDYVEKPFAIGEFMARLRAALRQPRRDRAASRAIEAGRPRRRSRQAPRHPGRRGRQADAEGISTCSPCWSAMPEGS